MRDFNNDGQINVQGDFNVTDNSHNEYKPLERCSVAELLEERPFRQENIRIEQALKVKRLRPLYTLCILLFVAAAAWTAINGRADLASLLMGAASVFIGYLSLKATIEPNSFQVTEQTAVNTINTLLKQRRAE